MSRLSYQKSSSQINLRSIPEEGGKVEQQDRALKAKQMKRRQQVKARQSKL